MYVTKVRDTRVYPQVLLGKFEPITLEKIHNTLNLFCQAGGYYADILLFSQQHSVVDVVIISTCVKQITIHLYIKVSILFVTVTRLYIICALQWFAWPVSQSTCTRSLGVWVFLNCFALLYFALFCFTWLCGCILLNFDRCAYLFSPHHRYYLLYNHHIWFHSTYNIQSVNNTGYPTQYS